jgi:hypothetical protein
MKKMNFEQFASSKIDGKKILGGTATTYDRPGGGSGTDTVTEGANCTTYVSYTQDSGCNYSFVTKGCN